MKKIILVFVAILILFTGWYLLKPLFVDNEIAEELPAEFAGFDFPTSEEFENMSEEEKTQMEIKMIEMFKDSGTTINESMESGPILVKSGQFTDADNFHKGSGVSKLLKNDSSYLLRFEDFMVTNGPALHVLLSENENPTDRDDLGEYIDLGELKGNVGNQNYIIPEGTDFSKYKSIVIYCMPFHVVFSVSELN